MSASPRANSHHINVPMKNLAAARALAICFIPCCGAIGFEPLIDDLPESEREARIRLADGGLDSATWDLVRQFYDEPLVVPLGELRYLGDVMPWLGELPVAASRLSRYEPWGEADVARFFRDFPALAPLRPILAFEASASPHLGVVGFTSSTRSASSLPRQSLRFNVSPGQFVRLDGSADFQDNYARWERRRIRVRARRFAEFQIGNFSPATTNDLFFGYFPSCEQARVETAGNWLYGDSRTYNGAAGHVSIGKRTSAAAFVHYRPTESAASVEAAVQPVHPLKIRCGVSALDAEVAPDLRDTSYAVHTGVDLSLGAWSAKVETGASTAGIGVVPVSVSCAYAEKGMKVSGSVVRIPGEFQSPRGRLAYDIRGSLDFADSVREDITAVQLAYAEDITAFMTHSYRVTYSIAESGSALETRCGLSGAKPLNYNVRYSFKPSRLAGQTTHRVYADCGRELGPRLGVYMRAAYYQRSQVYNRTKITLGGDINAAPSVTISPFASYAVNNRGGDDVLAGFTQRLLLFERTFGELSLTVPVASVEEEGIIVYARSSFFF